MPAILLHVLAAALYGGLALHFWRSRWRGPALDQPVAGLAGWERTWLLAALVTHGATLAQGIFPGAAMSFGAALALSLILWLAITLYWIESFYARMEGLQMLGLPLAAVCVLLPPVLPGQHLLVNADSPAFRAHFLMAMLAYSLFTLAALHAVLMAVAEKRLHRGRLTPLFAGLPPLLTMEALLFRLIHVAFALLTLTLVSGIVFSETLFGKALPFNHKTVFAILSWLIFAALLAGRHLRGWRGRLALRWTLAGFGTLLLAYIGSRFVLEVILGRI
ncbi:MAG: cytochrome c biogenesis protein CcsA [Gammaproteobacteria bacterium]|nr:cytochrome c biogenesis protein CcsA [Gammaproteobacteria bacterium]MBU1645933.1 cytochrome c biogenesis protein CcsA [Gammaproteobacteria bacterium]MBU1971995.1 cytochrome c biogenesis protein CcsA [Gammaproteobacteria bacterium]